ncbi:MAG: hypothetical protein ABSG36_17775 [Acidimicrobiales bacterium]
MPQAPATSSFAFEARRQAAKILSGSPYTRKPGRLPDPLGGILRAIGRAFVWALGRPSRWLWLHLLQPSFHFTSSWLGGGGWIVAVALALGFGIGVGTLLVRRRSRIAAQPRIRTLTSRGDRASDLELASERAESEGNNELAVRLRFQLGLEQLESRGMIPSGLTTSSYQLRRILRSPLFDELDVRHEFITYAHQKATSLDVDAARTGWGRLLDDVVAVGKGHEDQSQTPRSPR